MNILMVISMIFLLGCSDFYHNLIPSGENRIISFEIDGQIGEAIIGDNTIAIITEHGREHKRAIPRITVSHKATLFPITEDHMLWMFSAINTREEFEHIWHEINQSANLDAYLEDMIRRDPGFRVPVLDKAIDFSGPVIFLVMSASGRVRKYSWIPASSRANGKIP